MNTNIILTDEDKQVNLGGFPPIFKISTEFKKKREFNKSIYTINKNLLNNSYFYSSSQFELSLMGH